MRWFHKNIMYLLLGGFGVVVILRLKDGHNTKLSTAEEQLRLAKERVSFLEVKLTDKGKADSLVQVKGPLGREFDLVTARASIVKDVTVIMYSFEESADCLKSRIDVIFKYYSNIILRVVSSTSFLNPTSYNIEYFTDVKMEGKALEMATKNLKTKYFLYLSTGAEISQHVSDYSIGWLFHALETIPELDFVGGSFLRYAEGYKYPLFEVNCYRLRLCNWTFSQSYEYRYSVDDMMICEETSPSFMGRVSSLQKVPGQFDAKLDTMATTDFFLRAKGNAIVGLKPEVRFAFKQQCRLPVRSKSIEADLKLEFMRKYQLYILKDSWGREVLASDSSKYSSLQYNIDHLRQHTYHNPLYIRRLKLFLETSADYFESQNISYFLDAGMTLGGYRIRGIFPWDMDIDLGFFSPNWQEIREGLKDHYRKKEIDVKVSSVDWILGWHSIQVKDTSSGITIGDMYQHDEPVNKDWFMYIPIHGRHYPVNKTLTADLRQQYGTHFLENRAGKKDTMRCKLPGHHACVPDEYSSGGGHWREFYCQL